MCICKGIEKKTNAQYRIANDKYKGNYNFNRIHEILNIQIAEDHILKQLIYFSHSSQKLVRNWEQKCANKGIYMIGIFE